ncbi:hypothetical protein HMPREF1869_01376 [Bacteroidales bacterium KA00251]|nr:hypothetical protein HMPREF1869_01376 [Bacteroidales bacterium KA00251]
MQGEGKLKTSSLKAIYIQCDDLPQEPKQRNYSTRLLAER